MTKFKVYYWDPKEDVRGTWETTGHNPEAVKNAFFGNPVFKGFHIRKIKRVK